MGGMVSDTSLSSERSSLQIALPSGAIVARLPWISPEQLFAPLASTPFALWLDAASAVTTCATNNEAGARARYSFIMHAPYAEVIGDADWHRLESLGTHLASESAIWDGLSPDDDAVLPPFRGGIAGVLAYDCARLWTPPTRLPLTHTSTSPFPDIAFGAYAQLFAFDHATHQCFAIATGVPAHSAVARRRHAENAIADMETQISTARSAPLASLVPANYTTSMCHADFTRVEYQTAIDKIIALIHAGDVFQANLAQCFSIALTDDDSDFNLYRRYRRTNPAPFSAFLQYGDSSLACASPERFLSARKRVLEARPIKGTSAPTTSESNTHPLQQNTKERAENIMIVDVLRNDLAHSCLPDSICVPQLCAVEAFADIQHLVSVVRGVLRADKTPLQALLAAFPGGSITGAPKIRAMQRIAQYERTPRGAYCGTLGYIGFDGTMDMNIIIRSAQVSDGMVHYHAGGGITSRSNPADEYDETYLKAAQFFKSLGLTGGTRLAR